MTDLNVVVIRGRMAREPIVNTSQSGFVYGSFTLALNRSCKDKDGNWVDEPSFITVKGLGKHYESVSKHLAKGSAVIVEGYLQQERWEDKEGNKKTQLVVVADKIYPTYQKQSGQPSDEQGVPEEMPINEDIPF